MGEIVLRSDTKALEFGHLTSIDLELNSIIVELVYLSCLSFEYKTSAGKSYLYEYGVELIELDYTNPVEIFSIFKNVSKKTVEWVLDRTIFYKQELAKRQAEAELKQHEAEKMRQSAIEKKLQNLEGAYKLRQKMIKDGTNPDEANQMIAGLLVDQKATLFLPKPKPKGLAAG